MRYQLPLTIRPDFSFVRNRQRLPATAISQLAQLFKRLPLAPILFFLGRRGLRFAGRGVNNCLRGLFNQRRDNVFAV